MHADNTTAGQSHGVPRYDGGSATGAPAGRIDAGEAGEATSAPPGSPGGWGFHVLLATPDLSPWETEVQASNAVQAVMLATEQWCATVGGEMGTLTHVLARRSPGDRG